jgi:hypothetical protein
MFLLIVVSCGQPMNCLQGIRKTVFFNPVYTIVLYELIVILKTYMQIYTKCLLPGSATSFSTYIHFQNCLLLRLWYCTHAKKFYLFYPLLMPVSYWHHIALIFKFGSVGNSEGHMLQKICNKLQEVAAFPYNNCSYFKCWF